MTDRAILARELERLKAGSLSVQRMHDLLHDFGEEKFFEAEEEVKGALTHQNPEVRIIAIEVLSFHWDMAKYSSELEHVMANDSSLLVRGAAAQGLGYLQRESRDAKSTTALLRKVHDITEDGFVREAAFHALVMIWSRDSHKRTQGDLPKVLVRGRDLAQSGMRALELPEPLKELALDELTEDAEKSWELRIDWSVVAKIERGEMLDS